MDEKSIKALKLNFMGHTWFLHKNRNKIFRPITRSKIPAQPTFKMGTTK